MSIKPVTFYTLVCDFPDCGADFNADSEHAAFGSTETMQMVFEDSYAVWWSTTDKTKHYCGNHPMAWASDLADGDEEPDKPYLLIHDGDTDSTADDGNVSLIHEVES